MMDNSWIYHNSYDKYYRNPFGAISCSGDILLRVEVKPENAIENVYVSLWQSEVGEKKIIMELEEKKEEVYIYKLKITAPERPCLLWYYFIVKLKNNTYYYGNNQDNKGGIGRISNCAPLGYQITVYQNHYVPQWFNEGIFYQIFVDRFNNGCEKGSYLNAKKKSLLHGNWHDTPFYIRNDDGSIKRWDFFGGNLLGIIKKLPYLKDLGINSLYLNPVFEAQSNHKYDTGDYKKIDPMFGNEEIFKELCEKAKNLGINIILDGVFSHTGSDSIYFNQEGNYPSIGAFQSQDSPYYNWYRFKNYPHEYESWWGIGTLPNVNELEPTYLDYIIENEDSVIKHWMRNGAKGWRLDVADELPDEFIKKMKKTMKTIDKESILIGEVWEDASNKVSYGKLREYFWGDELDSVMNYPFRKILIDFILGYTNARDTYVSFMNLYENYPKHIFYSCLNLIGSHDVPRILTLLGEAVSVNQLNENEREHYKLNPDQREKGIKRLKLLSLIQMTFPGMPCIYYGDEAGMEGYSDPFNRGPFPWDEEDKDILNWYKQIIKLRNEYPIFTQGDFKPFYYQNDVFGYERYDKENLAFCLFNRNPQKECVVEINIENENNKSFHSYFNEDEKVMINEGKLKVIIAPLEGKIISTL